MKKLILRINKISLTIFASFIMEYLFTIGDQAIIGRTNLESFASVSIISNLLFAITGTVGVISVSLNILASNRLGSNDSKGYSKLFNTTLTISIIIGLLFQIAVFIFGKIILRNILGMEGEFLKHSFEYLSIAGFSVCLNMIIFILNSYIKSIEKPKFLVLFGVLSYLVNLSIDYILVFGKFNFPKLGVKGAAIGTDVGLLLYILLLIIYIVKERHFKFKLAINFEILPQLIKSYLTLLGQDFVEATGFTMVLTIFLTRLGVENAATYGLITTVINIVILPIHAYSSTTTTIVSKAVGGKDFFTVKYTPIISIMSLLIIFLIFTLIISYNRDLVFNIITTEKSVINNASELVVIALFVQIFNITNQIIKSSLNSKDDGNWVLIYSTIIGVLTLIIIYLLAFIYNLGLVGIFIGFGFNYLILSIGFYKRKGVIGLRV